MQSIDSIADNVLEPQLSDIKSANCTVMYPDAYLL